MTEATSPVFWCGENGCEISWLDDSAVAKANDAVRMDFETHHQEWERDGWPDPFDEHQQRIWSTTYHAALGMDGPRKGAYRADPAHLRYLAEVCTDAKVLREALVLLLDEVEAGRPAGEK